jgi:hypothetical protein
MEQKRKEESKWKARGKDHIRPPRMDLHTGRMRMLIHGKAHTARMVKTDGPYANRQSWGHLRQIWAEDNTARMQAHTGRIRLLHLETRGTCSLDKIRRSVWDTDEHLKRAYEGTLEEAYDPYEMHTGRIENGCNEGSWEGLGVTNHTTRMMVHTGRMNWSHAELGFWLDCNTDLKRPYLLIQKELRDLKYMVGKLFQLSTTSKKDSKS